MNQTHDVKFWLEWFEARKQCAVTYMGLEEDDFPCSVLTQFFGLSTYCGLENQMVDMTLKVLYAIGHKYENFDMSDPQLHQMHMLVYNFKKISDWLDFGTSPRYCWISLPEPICLDKRVDYRLSDDTPHPDITDVEGFMAFIEAGLIVTGKITQKEITHANTPELPLT